MGSAPDVQDLRQWNENCGRHGVADDVDDIQERMRFKITRHERNQTVENGGLECIDKVKQPDAVGRC